MTIAKYIVHVDGIGHPTCGASVTHVDVAVVLASAFARGVGGIKLTGVDAELSAVRSLDYQQWRGISRTEGKNIAD
jgi:hypothetical protein